MKLKYFLIAIYIIIYHQFPVEARNLVILGGGSVSVPVGGITQVGAVTSATKVYGYDDIVTASRTLGTGTNRLLLAVIPSYSSADVTAVTFDSGGANQTLFTKFDSSFHAESDYTVGMWYIKNAPSGASGTITVNIAEVEWVGHVVITEWTGVDQTTPLENFNHASGESTTPSVTITSSTGSVVIDGMCTSYASATVNGSQTQIYNADSTGGTRLGAVSKNAGAASVVMSWTIEGTYWGIAGASIKPAS
jgi:hypothetical protein